MLPSKMRMVSLANTASGFRDWDLEFKVWDLVFGV
jgi:hypothetical protein